MPSQRTDIVDWAAGVCDDLSFGAARDWVAAAPGRRACGFLPVYAPREIVRAAGMIPVGVWGGGDRVEIIRGDAAYQSYICHLPRSVVELAETGRLDFLAAMLFPSTCDVIRNLSGIWRLTRPHVYVRYLDVPQVVEPSTGGAFWEGELRTLHRELAELAQVPVDAQRLRAAIAEYNDARRLIRDLYALRREAPWQVPTEELYLLMRAGEAVPVDVFAAKARAYLEAAASDGRRPRDRARVVVAGAFCEQPPLGLVKTLEQAGCYIVDDDFLLGNRFIEGDVSLDGDPWAALARAFTTQTVRTSILFEPDPMGKRELMAMRAKAARAEGVVFAAPSFCDPALLDRPMLKDGAEAAGIPTLSFRYAENTGQFQQFREQAGTFSDSIKLWGGV